MKPRLAIVHVVSPESGSLERGREFLTESEIARAASFRFPEHEEQWIGFRAGLRRILGEAIGLPPRDVPISLTALGKPVLDPPFSHLHFSLSHCRDLALIALSTDGNVGVDLEPIARARDLDGCESTFCHPDEIAELPTEPTLRRRRMLEIWTAKEAVLKSLGTGFTHPPENVRILFGTAFSKADSAGNLPGMDAQVLHRLDHPALRDHIAMLSTAASVDRIEIVDHRASTSALQSAKIPTSSIPTDG